MSSNEQEPSFQPLRPSDDTILRSWTSFFSHPLLSLPHLKQTALEGNVPDALRSLYWRYFFGLLPSPDAPSSSTITRYSILLERSRGEYSELRDRFLRSPDGRWIDDGEERHSRRASSGKGRASTKEKEVAVQLNNPLSLDESSPWKAWFKDLELRRMIRQDVERTFPDLDYFRLQSTQDLMTNLLFVFAKLNPEIGYRQGIHEVLAPILYAVDFDSLKASDSTTDSLPHLVLSNHYVEHDTWVLFQALMRSAKSFYDFTPSVSLSLDKSASSTTSLTFAHSSAGNSPATSVLVQPVVGTSIRIHDNLLKTIDYPLWEKMESLQVEPQLYAIRWLRLLFGREFGFSDTLRLWDGLFAEDTSLRLMEQISIAMLLRIRDALLASDYSSFLQLLLHYPTPIDGNQRIPLLVRQAIYLRDNNNALAGAQCRSQNIELGAVAGTPFHEEYESERRPSSTLINRPEEVGSGVIGDLAKGLFGTFNDIRRNVAMQNQQIREEAARMSTPRLPPTEYASELRKLRSANSVMGEALNQCVDVLERDWSDASLARTTAKEPAVQSGQTLMALTVLKHIRDVLGGSAENFDPNVLAPLLRISPSTSPIIKSSNLVTSPIVTNPKTIPTLVGQPPPTIWRPISNSASSTHPTLLLGSRSDQPLPALSRTPQTRVIRTPLADTARSPPNSTLSSSPLATQVPQRKGMAVAAASFSSISKKNSMESDPLLGLGVEEGRQESRSLVVDPLGALG